MSVTTIDVPGMVRRSNRNVLLLTLVGFIILVVGVVLAAPYWLRQFSGPFPMTMAEVIATTPESLPLYNVVITGDQMLDTGYEEYTTTNGVRTSTDAYFGGLLLGEKILVVRVGSTVDETRTEYQGSLLMPASISKEVLDDINAEEPEIREFLLPFVLDAKDEKDAWTMGAVALVVLLLAVLYGLFQFFARSRNINKHPIMQGLARMGDPEQVLSEVNNELLVSEQKSTFPGLSFTRNWLVYSKGNALEAVRLGDVMWVYRQTVTGRGGTQHFVHVYDRYNRLIAIPGKENQVNEVIGAVVGRAPWAIGGYSEDIKKAWNTGRANFIATVDGRRQQGARPQ
ncbi:MAG: hypothetical protein MUE40_02205 [Anaerolineae bacterium]|nr:hypothetical protein [Anaerolineae bacterium]